jgi:hypothetical protein
MRRPRSKHSQRDRPGKKVKKRNHRPCSQPENGQQLRLAPDALSVSEQSKLNFALCHGFAEHFQVQPSRLVQFGLDILPFRHLVQNFCQEPVKALSESSMKHILSCNETREQTAMLSKPISPIAMLSRRGDINNHIPLCMFLSLFKQKTQIKSSSGPVDSWTCMGRRVRNPSCGSSVECPRRK